MSMYICNNERFYVLFSSAWKGTFRHTTRDDICIGRGETHSPILYRNREKSSGYTHGRPLKHVRYLNVTLI